jgi:hypothetical protein
MNNEQNKMIMPPRKRTRSPGYPTTNLREAMEKAKIIWKNDHRNECPLASLAEQWKYAPQSSAAAQLSAALKKYGLFDDVEGKNAVIKLSESAIRILSIEDEDSSERIALLKKAALAPAIYSDLWRKYQGILPSDATIKTYLISDLKFNPDVVEGVIKNFRDTITFAKLSPSDKFEGENEIESENKMDGQLKNEGQPAQVSASPVSPLKPGIKEMRFELDSGPVVVRYPMSGEDYDLLLESLSLWKKKLVQPHN